RPAAGGAAPRGVPERYDRTAPTTSAAECRRVPDGALRAAGRWDDGPVPLGVGPRGAATAARAPAGSADIRAAPGRRNVIAGAPESALSVDRRGGRRAPDGQPGDGAGAIPGAGQAPVVSRRPYWRSTKRLP